MTGPKELILVAHRTVALLVKTDCQQLRTYHKIEKLYVLTKTQINQTL